MTRSAEFATTIRCGVRATQPDIVVHAHLDSAQSAGPRIGFIVSRAVGDSVQRHRVARRLRHAARGVIQQLRPGDRIVVRALPGCRTAPFARLEDELAAGVHAVRRRQEQR
jgi:ribonuclease P protein component